MTLAQLAMKGCYRSLSVRQFLLQSHRRTACGIFARPYQNLHSEAPPSGSTHSKEHRSLRTQNIP